MNNLDTSGRQRGASAWTMFGSLLIAAGLAGLGVALIKPGGQTPRIAPVATQSGAAAPSTGSSAPAASAAERKPIAKTDPPSAGPHSNWHGTWRGATPDTELLITSTRVGECKWVTATEPRFDGECEAGYAKSSVSLANIARRFEESVARFQRDPSDFSITDPTQSRMFISRIKPGNYRVIWMQDGSDCGMGDMIIDGDLMLRVVDCGYRHQVSLFTRVR